MKALFITDSKDFTSEIKGGVQVCTREFWDLLELCDFELEKIEVRPYQNIFNRFRNKIFRRAYRLYTTSLYEKEMLNSINSNSITYVFINNVKLLNFAIYLKSVFGNQIYITLLSHGNEFGDYIHFLTRKKHNYISRIIGQYKLGQMLYFESITRQHYIDNVFVLSEQERRIEQWIGIKSPLVVNRIFNPKFVDWKPVINRIGFVGTLNHLPNEYGLQKLMKEIVLKFKGSIEVRLIGGPRSEGMKFEQLYDEITYLGPLSSDEFLEEVKTWSIYLNPVFYYSRGASTKLAEGLNLGIPVLSTDEGNRGYKIIFEKNLCCESAIDMVYKIDQLLSNQKELFAYKKRIEHIANSGQILEDIVPQVKGNLGIQ